MQAVLMGWKAVTEVLVSMRFWFWLSVEYKLYSPRATQMDVSEGKTGLELLSDLGEGAAESNVVGTLIWGLSQDPAGRQISLTT